GEGILNFSGPQTTSFEEWFTDQQCQGNPCPLQALPTQASYRATAQAGGVAYEVAIPLDGPAPLRAGAGQRFGFRIALLRDGTRVACFPSCTGKFYDPATFRNLILASGGCNSGPQAFGYGSPHTGLPL